jgi:hypothetical protein
MRPHDPAGGGGGSRSTIGSPFTTVACTPFPAPDDRLRRKVVLTLLPGADRLGISTMSGHAGPDHAAIAQADHFAGCVIWRILLDVHLAVEHPTRKYGSSRHHRRVQGAPPSEVPMPSAHALCDADRLGPARPGPPPELRRRSSAARSRIASAGATSRSSAISWIEATGTPVLGGATSSTTPRSTAAAAVVPFAG